MTDRTRRMITEAYVNRGAAYDNKTEYDRAIADEAKGIELEPGNGHGYYFRGIAYAAKHELTKAVSDFRAAARLIPASDQWHHQALARVAELEKQLATSAPAAQVAPGAAHAERRVALIVGNDKYEHLVPLQKAVADATAYADVLKAKGFDQVVLKTDLSRSGMDEAIANFIDQIQPGDTAVFAYSGHGWSDGTQNYIVGTDAPVFGSQELLARISIPLKDGAHGIIDEMDRQGAALKVAIIDACRDNPFTPAPGKKGVGISRGLVRIEPPHGTFVVFSAGAGQSALDRLSDGDPDPNSVFTRIFAASLRANLTLQEAIKTTQAKVVALAKGINEDQVPAYYDEVIGSACLSDSCMGATAPTSVTTRTSDADVIFWESVKDSSRKADFEAYLAKFPDGIFVTLAKTRIAALDANFQSPEKKEPNDHDLNGSIVEHGLR
jgi:hypothetical protein